MEITPDFNPRFRTKQKQNKLECSVFQALGLCGQGAAKNKEKRGRGKRGKTGKRGLHYVSFAFCLIFAPNYLNARAGKTE